MQEVIDIIKHKTGYPIVSVCNTAIKWIKSDYTLFNASPEEFLGLYDHAAVVVSASFHGTALGLVFRKPTYGLVKKTHGNRIRELMEVFGLGSFCLSENDLIPEPDDSSDQVEAIMQEEITKSMTFLKESIDNNGDKTRS